MQRCRDTETHKEKSFISLELSCVGDNTVFGAQKLDAVFSSLK